MPDQILTDQQIENILPELNVAWSDIPGQGLVRVFNTGSFNSGVKLINQIAKIAQEHNHHPDIHLTFSEVEVTLSTHSVGGVTQRDIDLAKAIDQLS